MPSATRTQKRSKPKTKKDRILAALNRPEGATIADLTKLTRWQAHSVRGFLAGTVKKKLGLTLVSEKNASGARVYRIARSDGTEG